MNKTTIKASIKKNKTTRQCEIRVHIDSPYAPGSDDHEAITDRLTAELWAANFPNRNFNSEGVKLFVMNHTTGEYEEVDELSRQHMFNRAVQRQQQNESPIIVKVPVQGGKT